MAADEAGTHAALKQHREAEFNPAVQRHNGRIVKLIGDGALVEFLSVVDAVKCALDIQVAAASRPAAGGTITLRIGINLGDVIIDGDDIYGDGVNVASRLEPLADPGGICIASIVNESVANRIDVRFEDGGDVAVKNIDRPIRIWKWRPGAASSSQPVKGPSTAETVRRRASIAVLPFANMSGDPGQEYFSDGIAEDLITDLSKIGGLAVIARNSSFAYKGKSPDIRNVGRELGVTSVLEGSVRKVGNRIRINAQLIDASNGEHIWAERFDRDLTDVFDLQDEVTRKIVDALKVQLTPNESARLDDIGTRNFQAHDFFLRGRELMSRFSGDTRLFNQAREHFNRASELDPNYGDAYAGLALVLSFSHNNQWTELPQSFLKQADELATKAAGLSPQSPFCLHVLSMTAGFSGDLDRSWKATNAALAISPNDAEALNSRGALNIFSGNPAMAVPDIERAILLDPGDASQRRHFLGIAHLLLGQYENAAAQFRQRILVNPETDLTRAMLASALGHMGEIKEANRIWSELKTLNPKYSFETHMNRLPFRDKRDAEPIAEGLRKARLLD